MIKLCSNCEHYSTYRHTDGMGRILCEHPKANHSNVDGRPVETCESMRVWLFGKCGKSARLFEEDHNIVFAREHVS